jgi:exopolysaccharide production protein ExoQ
MTAISIEFDDPVLLPWIVGFFFAFRIIIVVLSVRLLGSDPQSGVVLSLAMNYLLLIAASLHAMRPARITISAMLRLPTTRWVAFFLAFTGCSLAWTVSASWPAAAAYWVAMLADSLIVLLLLSVGTMKLQSHLLMKGFIWGACAVALIAWILPRQADLRLGDEQLLGPNQIGYVCAFAFLFAQYLMRERDGRWGLQAAFLALTLLRSLSKTSIIAFVVCQSYLLLRDDSIRRRSKLFAIAIVLVAVACFWGLLSAYYEVYSNAGNQAETLTGRLGIWAFIFDESLKKPWLGHGFHSVWKVIPPFGDFEARHAHNEMLQQFYAYGVLGVIMLTGLYGSLGMQLHRIADKPRRVFLLSILVFVLVRGLTDTEVFDLSLPVWAIMLISLLVAETLLRDTRLQPS